VTPTAASPDVCVIDDDLGIHKALGSLFRSAGLTVSTHHSIGSFLAANVHDGAGCLVLDVKVPGQSGRDFLWRLPLTAPTVPIILVTGHINVPMTVRAMKAGAVDVLCKPVSDADLLAAVAAALEDNRTRRQLQAENGRLQELFATLTPREREVMGLVTAGLMNKQIAGRLDLSEITVKIHRGNVMRKLRAPSLADLVRMAECLHARDRLATRVRPKAA
jgi:FixJ family two-component response regulator